MKFNFLLYFFTLCLYTQTYAQLPNGATAPDFTINDINGVPYSLYSKMGNKGACIAFEATWCGVCWQFHEDGILQNIFSNLAADATAVFIESDFTTNSNCLYGMPGCNVSTHGNWVVGSPYPICDLTASNGPNVANAYAQTYWPMIYVISPDKRAWEVRTLVYQEFVNWLTKSFKLSTTASVSNCTCGDNGKIQLNISGGYGNLSYNWNNGSNSKDLIDIPGGTYSVTITDQNGYFKSFGPWSVTNPPKRVDISSAQLTPVKCFNETTGSIDLQVSFGVPPYTYIWSNGKTTKNIDQLKAGSYSITVSDLNGCTKSKTYTILQPSDLILTSTSTKEDCDEMNATINAKALGGVPPYHFDLGYGSQQTGLFTDLKGGKEYALTLTDENVCVKTIKVQIEVTHKPNANAGPPRSFADCRKESLILDGSKSSNGANLAYLWTTTDGNILKGAETLQAEINRGGSYQLKISDLINKCIDVESVQVNDNRIYPNIVTVGDTTLNCKLTKTELKGNSDFDSVIYYWKKIADTSFYVTGKNLFTQDSGRFLFYVKDTNSLCTSHDTVIVLTDQDIPLAQIFTPADLSCKTSEIIIDATGSSSSPLINYEWNTANGHIVSGNNSTLLTVNKKGTYTLRLFNKINYCETFDSTLVEEQTEILPDIWFILNGLTVNFEDRSAGKPLSWIWDFGEPGSSTNFSTEKNPSHTYNAAGTYAVKLILENECGEKIWMWNVNPGALPPLKVSSIIVQNKCFGDSSGSISLDVSGGLSPYTYLWSNQETGAVIRNLYNGNYTVVVKDHAGNEFHDNYTINSAPDFNVIVGITHSNGNLNGQIELQITNGSPPFQIEWFNVVDSLPVKDILNLSPGAYYCRVTDATGCIKYFGPYLIKNLTSNNDQESDNLEKNNLLRFDLMPNPVHTEGAIAISFKSRLTYQLILYNGLAEKIYSESFDNSAVSKLHQFEKYPPGIYFVVLRFGKNSEIRKWVVN